jgi:hypothetical protein
MSTSGVPIANGVLVFATPAGKPVVYATVSQAGKATLFMARGCAPE